MAAFKTENKMLKEALYDEQTQWQKKVIQLELKNADLEQAVAEMKKEKTVIESEKESLILQQTAQEHLQTIKMQQKQSEADKALQALKQKASELCKAKLSEGRLQIEVNQLKTEVKEYKEKLEFCIVGYQKKFDDLTRVRNTAKNHNCKKCKEIKALFEKMIHEDDKFCKNYLKSESSRCLDGDEKFEMIKNFLRESFLEKKSHVTELLTLMKTVEETNNSLRNSQKLIQDLSEKNEELSKMMLDIRSEVVELEKENLDAREVVGNLKHELLEIEKLATTLLEKNKTARHREKNMESKVSSLTNILSDIKVEMLELEKLSVSLQKANNQLNRDIGKKDEHLSSLNKECVTKTCASLQKKYQLLLNKERASLAAIAKQKNSIEDRDQIIQRLQDEVGQLKQTEQLC